MPTVGRSLCCVGVVFAILAIAGCGRQSAPLEAPAPAKAAAVKEEPQVIVLETPPRTPKFKQEMDRPIANIRFQLENYGTLMDPRAYPFLMQEFFYVKEGFAELEPATLDDPCPWYKVRLNSLHTKLDGIRFRNLFESQCDLVWAFALPREVFDSGMYWGIVQGPNSLSRDFTPGHLKRRLALGEIGLPDDNCVVFQQLEGHQLNYTSHGIIWFMTQNYSEPYDVYVKLKLIDARTTLPTATKPQDLAPHLKFELPFELNSSATVVDHALEAAETQGALAGLQMLEKELAGSPSRETEFTYANMAQGHAYRLRVEKQDIEGAAPYFQKSAEVLRKIKQANPELTTQEKELLKAALYNEACSLARQGDTERAMQVLEEAVENGNQDAAWIRGDEDLKSLRALPAFDALLRKLEEGM